MWFSQKYRSLDRLDLLAFVTVIQIMPVPFSYFPSRIYSQLYEFCTVIFMRFLFQSVAVRNPEVGTAAQLFKPPPPLPLAWPADTVVATRLTFSKSQNCYSLLRFSAFATFYHKVLVWCFPKYFPFFFLIDFNENCCFFVFYTQIAVVLYGMQTKPHNKNTHSISFCLSDGVKHLSKSPLFDCYGFSHFICAPSHALICSIYRCIMHLHI